nr:hypothetical protein [Tanacetum cinerariifolium]
YLQNEHYALWEVIEFGDSYKAPPEETGKGPASESSAKKKGRTLRFSKYETAKELWKAILKTFGGNEATKKTKKNQLKQQYGNFKAEGSETLEQTFNRLQAIVSHLKFVDVEIEQEDLNQNFLTSLAPEWLMYTIVQRNRDDLDIMSLDDVYNHLKVYELEVQKKSESNSQNMAFISSSNTSSGKSKVSTASVPTASTQVSTASTDVAATSLSHDTICAYIATQSNGSQIKYEDITQIDEDDIEKLDIKWNMALLSIGWDWSYMANEEENHAPVVDDEVPTEFVLMAKSSLSTENEYLQNEHYALWEVIEFGDSYKAPPEETGKGPASESSAKKKGRTVVITTEDMQKRRNDVKARTTLLLQAIVSHLKFVDVEIEQEYLNQNFLISLAPEWLMYTIVQRNRDDLDIMSLDDVYNHLKVYELEVQKKSESNSQNMAFISSSNTSSGKSKVSTASVPTASTQVSTTSTDVVAASLSHDTICAYIATQSNGSQIKYEDITQIDEDDIEKLDIKWNMALLSMRADRFEDTFREEAGLSNMETSIYEEPKKIFDALKDPSWEEAMQEELLQFKI